MMRNISCFLLLTILFVIVPVSISSGGGDITFTPKNAGKVLFSHDLHTKARGVKCMACHFSKFAAGTNGFQIKKETLNKREFCGHCHNGLKGFDLESLTNCNRCHKQ
ncbi:MAG TPA: c(7)-type cytochrome triheme domain-containing protein [Nitrospirota bacterium]|nr:c(7)-type cytochrome triheme domain-containing protein [Nitrospirota bacterium]